VAALKSFKSVKRRLEVKAQVNGITIIDDFAHHPTAIAGTLKALRARYPARACGQFSNHDPTRCVGMFCRMNWRAASPVREEIVVANVFSSEVGPGTRAHGCCGALADLQKRAKAAGASCRRRRRHRADHRPRNA
jgi:UDP-N-acetylmuramate: L-alanyl-gamma-D-glutamyl-meso-diaminopimelate ligase